MSMLRELQLRFAAALDGGDEGADDIAAGQGLGARQRLSIYRNNVLVGRLRALETAYPVTRALVGDDFFGAAAREYAVAAPSRSGNMNDYGAEFATFIAAFRGAAVLPWLQDVARLEWALQRAGTAADAPTLDRAALADVPAVEQPCLRFALHPSAQLLELEWPALAIWRAQRDGTLDAMAEIERCRQWLLVLRRDEIEIEPITPAVFRLLEQFMKGATIADAAAAALALEPALDLARTLHRCFERATLVSYSL